VLTIPSSALERGPDGLFTYLVKSDSTVAMAPLTTGVETNGFVVVQKGLKAGDTVVASNQYRLQPGSHIKPNAARSAQGQPSRTPEGAP
jgi:multidrug efflux system membrane fusion protein